MTTRSARRREILDEETILDATATILRRHGPAKATVLDVARELGVSHGSVYRFFPSKAALREEVTRRWLTAGHGVLAGIAARTDLPPPARLESWLGTLFGTTRGQVADDPELFATFLVLVREQSGVVDAHVAELRRAVSRDRVVVRRAGAGGAGEKLLKVCQGGARPSSRAVARPAI